MAPWRIDVLTSIDGVTFDEAWDDHWQTTLGGVLVSVIGRDQILKNKRAAGRPKDLADVAWLESKAGKKRGDHPPR